MHWSKPGLVLAVVAVCCAMGISGAVCGQKLTVYTVQTSYSLPVLDRDGKPYVSVTDLLTPLGASRPIAKGKEWRLTLDKAEVRLSEGKEKGTIPSKPVDLGGK